MFPARVVPLLPFFAALVIVGAATFNALRGDRPARAALAAPLVVVAALYLHAGRRRRP